MNKIRVNLKKRLDESYDVVVGRNHLAHLPSHLRDQGPFSSYVIITDSKVRQRFGKQFFNVVKKVHPRTFMFSFPAGEKFKTQSTKSRLEDEMLKKHCGRDTLILALGGGVVGDLAGFVAATYMRGIPYVQVPTTLLAMVDSSLGGKTGIDTKEGKNLIGAFWQPKKVFINLDFLKGLSQKQVLNGFYEIVKMGITSDASVFSFAELNLSKVKAGNLAVLENLIVRGIKIKAKVVEADEKENDDRMILNFGHTIGHALEKLSNYKLLHGEAVALGVMVEAKISQQENLLSKHDFNRIESLLVRAGTDIAVFKKWTAKQIIHAARQDKKTRGGKLKVVLIKTIGQLHRKDGLAASSVGDEVIARAIKSFN